MDNYIICKLCGKKFTAITNTHLKSAHNISVSEYKKLFPGAKYFSEVIENKLKTQNAWNKGLTKETDARVLSYSLKLQNRKMPEEIKNKISNTKKGCKSYVRTPEFRAKQSQATKGSSRPKLTEEQKTKISKANKGIIKDEEWRKKLSLSLKGKKHPPERIKAMVEGLVNKFFRRKDRITKPEMKVLSACPYLDYTGNKVFWLKFKDNIYKNPDFIVPDRKIVIEVFGDYWHKGEDTNILIEKYNNIGWECLVLWEWYINWASKIELKEIIEEYIDCMIRANLWRRK